MANDKVSIWNQTIKLGRPQANGELLIGNGADFNLAALTAGSNVTITNTAGGILIASTNPGGTVTGVTATSPLASTGGTAPDISLSGTIAVANGGTGATTLTSNNVILGNGTNAVQFVAPGTSGNLLTSNGTTWSSSAPASQWTRVWKTSDQSVTSSTGLVDDNSLSFPVSANKTYSFVVNVVQFSGGGGSFFAVNGPSTPTSIRFGADAAVATTSYNTSTTTWNPNITVLFRASGVIVVGSTGGTVVLRFAQSVSNATSMTVYKGSWLEWAEVG